MAFTIRRDFWSATSPKTTCLPSSQLVTTVVMKNWDPLLQGRVSICDSIDSLGGRSDGGGW